jgi:hypothetical protein
VKPTLHYAQVSGNARVFGNARISDNSPGKRPRAYPLAAEYRYKHVGMAAQPVGERRPPKAGEWYLSGAIPEAYRAPTDLSVPFHIVRLVSIHAARRA